MYETVIFPAFCEWLQNFHLSLFVPIHAEFYLFGLGKENIKLFSYLPGCATVKFTLKIEAAYNPEGRLIHTMLHGGSKDQNLNSYRREK
jgi:hypothetical protein